MIQEKTVKSACSPYCHLYIQLVDFRVRIIIYDTQLNQKRLSVKGKDFKENIDRLF